jgi:hypothetical protein
MKSSYTCIFLCIVSSGVMSCTVTNNLYVNNPTPLGKERGEIYAGIGTGVTPKVDSITAINKLLIFRIKFPRMPSYP